MTIIGITGGIGAGKTTALACFQELGGHVLEADEVTRHVCRQGSEAYQMIIGRWGSKVIGKDGDIDRGAIAELVFGDADQLAWLNSIIHPRVQQAIVAAARSLAGGQTLFCAVPLLFEVGWENQFDWVICVWCDPATQQERLEKRGWSREQIKLRQKHQWSMDRKAEPADFVVVNIGSHDLLEIQCRHLYNQLARQPARSD